MRNKPNILFLADTTHPASAVKDHISAVTSGELFSWHLINPILNKTIDKMDLSSFDAIGIHYSIKPYGGYYLTRLLKQRLASYSGIKFIFLQDEYQKINEVQDFMHLVGMHVLFTLVREPFLKSAYPSKKVEQLVKVPVLTAYASEEMMKWKHTPVKDRVIDVSYRARNCNYWLGLLAHEKTLIAQRFIKYTKEYNLRLDISLEESARLYGDRWLQLLNCSKSVLGTESGASIWDFDGSIERMTKRFLKRRPKATFDTVYNELLKPYDGKILYNAISPRIFEAAATKTPMILFPGHYNDICQPDKHYILLEKDCSNIKEVVDKLRDLDFLQDLADRTFDDLISSGKYLEHNLSQLVNKSLSALLKVNVSYKDELAVAKEVYEQTLRYVKLNRWRKAKAEVGFMFKNLWLLLTSQQNSRTERFLLIWKGLQRYKVYLKARTNK
jgi:hypothetical protein